MNKTKQKDMW